MFLLKLSHLRMTLNVTVTNCFFVYVRMRRCTNPQLPSGLKKKNKGNRLIFFFLILFNVNVYISLQIYLEKPKVNLNQNNQSRKKLYKNCLQRNLKIHKKNQKLESQRKRNSCRLKLNTPRSKNL